MGNYWIVARTRSSRPRDAEERRVDAPEVEPAQEIAMTSPPVPYLLRSLALVSALAWTSGTSSGCGALVAGGAGAGAAVYMTSRGAESQVNVPIARAYDASLAVLRARGIVIESQHVDDGGAERDIDAQLGDLDVDVSLRAVGSDITEIEVKAHRAPLGRDNDYAADLLSEIVGAADAGRVSVAEEEQPRARLARSGP
jgi:hypothetical protein